MTYEEFLMTASLSETLHMLVFAAVASETPETPRCGHGNSRGPHEPPPGRCTRKRPAIIGTTNMTSSKVSR